MTQKFLESDVVDSKKFQGAVLTLLGEILSEIRAQQSFLQETLFVPKGDSPSAYEMEEMEEGSYDPDQEDDE